MESGSGSVDRSQVRHVMQHELDTADRLAALGYRVVFRQLEYEATADAYVNGVRAEFKSSSSRHVGTIQRQVTKRRKNEGPRFVVDITESPLSITEVAVAMRQTCDQYPDEEIASTMVVDQQAIAMVGKEVPEWRM